MMTAGEIDLQEVAPPEILDPRRVGHHPVASAGTREAAPLNSCVKTAQPGETAVVIAWFAFSHGWRHHNGLDGQNDAKTYADFVWRITLQLNALHREGIGREDRARARSAAGGRD